jgi:uncharacterized membrane protein
MSYQFADQSHAISQTSSFGLAPNVAALVSYVWIPVTSIAVLVTEKENRLVRFHAWQALFLGLSLFALTIVLSIVIGVVTLVAGAVSPYAGLLVSVVSLLLWLVIALGMLGVWVLCLMKAYRSETYKLPVVGKFAENMANK